MRSLGTSMRRTIPTILLALLALAPAAQARSAPRALVTTCDRVHQAAVFEGRMDTVPHAVRMQMRFRLQVSTPDAPDWVRLSVPGFSAWVTSDPDRTRYVYAKRVEALLAPAAYRVQLRFRWLDAAGLVLRTAQEISRPCRQPDPRPDLRVVGLSAWPGDSAASLRYAVSVRNTGRGDAAASAVTLALPDGTTLRGAVPPIAPGEREVVFLSGPACARGDSLRVTADADDAVDEVDERGDPVTLACPSA
jgi:hypothetical protein